MKNKAKSGEKEKQENEFFDALKKFSLADRMRVLRKIRMLIKKQERQGK